MLRVVEAFAMDFRGFGASPLCEKLKKIVIYKLTISCLQSVSHVRAPLPIQNPLSICGVVTFLKLKCGGQNYK